jgi:hypothetical protein
MAIVIRRLQSILAVVALAAFASSGGPAWGQAFSVTITVDENCNGALTNSAGFNAMLTCVLAPDPGPGGAVSALTYDLLNPPGLVEGDLILYESSAPGAPISDVIRFNASSPQAGGLGSLVFYSSLLGGGTAMADIGFPSAFFLNSVSRFELHAPGMNGFTYTPLRGEPGFVAGAGGPVTYVIRSDEHTVPEPATLVLLAAGLAMAGVWSARARAPATRRPL